MCDTSDVTCVWVCDPQVCCWDLALERDPEEEAALAPEGNALLQVIEGLGGGGGGFCQIFGGPGGVGKKKF